MADILGFPYGPRPGDVYTPCDVEPPCEGRGLESVAANLPTPDPVKRPAHYVQNGVEAIDIIEHVLFANWGDTAVKGYLQGNVLKYLLRAPHKGDEAQDMAKAKWYLNRLNGRY